MDENDNPAENLAPPLPPVPPAPPEGSSLQQKMIASTLGLIGIPVSASIIITTLLLLYASHGDAVINKYVYMGFILLILAIIAFSARMDYLFYERTKSRIIIPLQQLSLAAHAIQYGNFNVVVDHHSDDELGEVCNTFRTMQSYLKNSIAERAHLLTSRKILFSGITHDLRTPLTTIMGYTEALQLGLGKTPEKRKQYLASIASCADDLSKLIDELSLYNKLSTSRIICHPVPTNFSRAIHSFINEDLEYLQSRNVNVSYNTDDSIIAMLDEKEFQRVVFNLLANTIKYRDKDTSEVLIQIYRKGKYAEFTYQDDGPGVPPEKTAHIFEAFYRTYEARSKTSNGSGLGLAIVAEIVTAHKGRYRAVNENGLKMIFDIPLKEGSNTK